VSDLAKEERVSLSLKAHDLVREALGMYEDEGLAALARNREECPGGMGMLDHDEVW
jgi:hypothetical protein